MVELDKTVEPLDAHSVARQPHRLDGLVEAHVGVAVVDRRDVQGFVAFVEPKDLVGLAREGMDLIDGVVLVHQVAQEVEQHVARLILHSDHIKVRQAEIVGDVEPVNRLVEVTLTVEIGHFGSHQHIGQVVGEIGGEELPDDGRHRHQLLLDIVMAQQRPQLAFLHLGFMQHVEEDDRQGDTALAKLGLQGGERHGHEIVVVGVEVIAEQVRLRNDDGEVLLAAKMHPFGIDRRGVVLLVENHGQHLFLIDSHHGQQMAFHMLADIAL